MRPLLLLLLPLSFFIHQALAQQPAPSWGGEVKKAAPAGSVTGQPTAPAQSGTRPPPPPPARTDTSGQSSGKAAAPPPPPPPPPGAATISGPVTYFAFGTFEASGVARRLAGSGNILGRNITSVEHQGSGSYLLRLQGMPATVVCVANALPEAPDGNVDNWCVAKTYIGSVGVSCLRPGRQNPGTYESVARAFSIVCLAP